MVVGLQAYQKMTDLHRADNRATLIADIWARIASNINNGVKYKNTQLLVDAQTLVQDGLIGTWTPVEESVDAGLSTKLLSLYRWFSARLSTQIWLLDANELEPLLNVAKTQEEAWRSIADVQ